MKKLNILTLLFLIPGLALAQNQGSFLEQYQLEVLLVMFFVFGVVVVTALWVVWSGLNALIKERSKEKGQEVNSVLLAAREGEEHLGFWSRFGNRFNSAVPVALEESVATDHEYDGIRELDNEMPPWWLYGFYITIIFGVIYLLNYEVFGSGMTQDEEYQAQMTEANTEVQAYLETISEGEDVVVMELLTDEVALAAGAMTFKVNCAQCHAQDGGGMNALGPNLTDKYWKNGGDFDALVEVINNGISGTSMIPWTSQLRPAKIQEVASFIYALEGTSPANPKGPEGELFERSTEIKEAPTDTTAVGS